MNPIANKEGQQPGATGLAHDSIANINNVTPNSAIASADQLRDQALFRIATKIDLQWQAQAEAALLAAIDAKGVATVDDARSLCPPPAEPNWWCYIPARLSRRRMIVRCGGTKGIAPVTHGGELRGWMRPVGGGK
jgi:hypothetical protein